MGKDLNGKELGKGISQRKDGRYEARFVNRFGKRDSVYGKTIKEVKNELNKAKAENTLSRNVICKNITLDEWNKKWMEVYKIPVVRENTKIIYENVYKSKISPYIGKTKLADITKLQVADMFNKLKDKGYKWETLNKSRILLIDMLDRAYEDDLILKNPAKGVRLPLNKSRNSYRTLSRNEQQVFFECSSGTFYHNLFVVAINTGLRPGELFALTKDDLDFDRKNISVTKTLLYGKFDGDEKKEFRLGEPKTSTSTRKVPMNDICRNALIKQLIQHKVITDKIRFAPTKRETQEKFSDLIFTTKFGTPLNSELYCEAIDRILCEINLSRDKLEEIEKFSGHSFRHTFATRCFEAGISPKTVQEYLGHATLAMTMDLYTTVMEEKKQEDMALLEENIGIQKQDVSKYTRKIIHMYA